ncbi:MAG: hypothetical protein JO000_16500 [Alphaproteobacteria bacterium]|nr:hypothetical protein [Alphaproteobacteria bacterium]
MNLRSQRKAASPPEGGNVRPVAASLIGPSAAGFAYDVAHSYLLPIIVSVVANIIAAAIVGLLPIRARN